MKETQLNLFPVTRVRFKPTIKEEILTNYEYLTEKYKQHDNLTIEDMKYYEELILD